MNEKIYKLYACGTVGFELDPKNAGPIDFYCSADALQDDLPCAEECGIVEYELRSIRTVKSGVMKLEKPKTPAQFAEEHNVYVALADKVLTTIADTPDEVQKSALTWALAGLKMDTRRKRRAARKMS